MLTSIRQVNEQFFRKFFGLTIPIGDAEKKILCRYARKSSYDYTEEQQQQVYPCIAIQDYAPVPKEEWFIDMHAYFGGKSLDGLTGYLYQRPIWMEFKYDVSIVSKSYNEYMAMQDYFMRNFVYGKRFIFNQYFQGEYAIGDIVPYTIRDTDVPRTDGVFETNYEFTCSVWLYPRKPEEVELVRRVVINMERNDAALYDVKMPDESIGEVIVVEKDPKAQGEERKIIEATTDVLVSEYPSLDRSIDVLVFNRSSENITVTVSGDFKTPDNEDIEIVVNPGGYAEISFLNISGIIYARGA